MDRGKWLWRWFGLWITAFPINLGSFQFQTDFLVKLGMVLNSSRLKFIRNDLWMKGGLIASCIWCRKSVMVEAAKTFLFCQILSLVKRGICKECLNSSPSSSSFNQTLMFWEHGNNLRFQLKYKIKQIWPNILDA